VSRLQDRACGFCGGVVPCRTLVTTLGRPRFNWWPVPHIALGTKRRWCEGEGKHHESEVQP